jgi:hypothetical protein
MSDWPDQLPEGLRWATGGGSVAGDPGNHVAPERTRGSLCGRYVPEVATMGLDDFVCGSCARILLSKYGLRVQTRYDRFTGRHA